MSTIFNCNSPPLFLATPGPVCVPWRQWKLAFLSYVEASGGEQLSLKRRKAILLNALGLEVQWVYYSSAPIIVTPASHSEDSRDAFEEALAVLNKHFDTTVNELMEQHRFGVRRQMLGEAFEVYSVALRELAAAASAAGWKRLCETNY